MKNIILQQPQAFDLVDQIILISGIGVASKGVLTVYIGDGHYEIKDYIKLSSKAMKQFQAKVKIPEDIKFKLDKIYLVIIDENIGDNKKSESSRVFTHLIYAPNILDNYIGFYLYKVKKGDTLSKLARKYYKNPNSWKIIYRANIDRIVNPNIIYEGEILRIPISN